MPVRPARPRRCPGGCRDGQQLRLVNLRTFWTGLRVTSYSSATVVLTGSRAASSGGALLAGGLRRATWTRRVVRDVALGLVGFPNLQQAVDDVQPVGVFLLKGAHCLHQRVTPLIRRESCNETPTLGARNSADDRAISQMFRLSRTLLSPMPTDTWPITSRPPRRSGAWHLLTCAGCPCRTPGVSCRPVRRRAPAVCGRSAPGFGWENRMSLRSVTTTEADRAAAVISWASPSTMCLGSPAPRAERISGTSAVVVTTPGPRSWNCRSRVWLLYA